MKVYMADLGSLCGDGRRLVPPSSGASFTSGWFRRLDVRKLPEGNNQTFEVPIAWLAVMELKLTAVLCALAKT